MRRFLLTLFVLTFLLCTLMACTQVVQYTVRPGDTLSAIALQYKTTVNDIVTLNTDRYPELRANPAALRPGMILQIETTTDLGDRVFQVADKIASQLENPSTPTPDLNPTVITTGDKIQTADALVWQMINQAREGNRLRDLALDVTLTRIAVARSEDLIRRDYFSHNDPATGHVAFEDLLKANKYAYQLAGENIAEIRNEGVFVPNALTVYQRYSAQELANQFVTGWLNSPEHRDNIMNSRFRRTGIAIATTEQGTRIVATQVFSD